MQQGFAGVRPYYEPTELNLKTAEDTKPQEPKDQE